MSHQKILLVDDDPDDQELFCDIVNKISPGLACEIAENGARALTFLRERSSPSIIFLDLNMPIMNGYEFLKEASASNLFSGIPVVVYTTSSGENDMMRVKKFGVKRFLTKLSNPSQTQSQIENTLKDANII